MRSKNKWRLASGAAWFVFFVCVLGGKPMAASTESEGARSANVTIDVYSGRPNPTWSLPGTTASELLKKISLLRPASTERGASDKLGYKSLSADVLVANGTVAILASRGRVTVERDGRRVQYEDPEGGVELWLLNTGSDHVSPAVMQSATREIIERAK